MSVSRTLLTSKSPCNDVVRSEMAILTAYILTLTTPVCDCVVIRNEEQKHSGMSNGILWLSYCHLTGTIRSGWHSVHLKLQALLYDILPSTTAVFSYAIGSRKLSANEQFFVGAQTVVSLLQTTQIISDVCFITDHVAYASSNQTTIV